MSYENLTIVGNLGSTPEMRYTPAGTAVTNFSMAVNRRWTSNDEEQELTVWYRITAWGKLAEVCNEYLDKGRQVLVVGQLQADEKTGGPRVYERNDGTAGASFEVTAQTVRFLGNKGDVEVEPKRQATRPKPEAARPEFNEDEVF